MKFLRDLLSRKDDQLRLKAESLVSSARINATSLFAPTIDQHAVITCALAARGRTPGSLASRAKAVSAHFEANLSARHGRVLSGPPRKLPTHSIRSNAAATPCASPTLSETARTLC